MKVKTLINFVSQQVWPGLLWPEDSEALGGGEA